MRFRFPRIPALLPVTLALAFGVGFPAVQARDGVLRTTAGATHRGELRFATNGVVVRADGAEPVTVPVDQLVELTLTEPAAVTASAATNAVPVSTNATSAVGTNVVAAVSSTNAAPAGITNVVVAPATVPAPAPAPPVAAVNGWNASPVGPGASGRLVPEEEALLVVGAGSGLRGNSDSVFLGERRMGVSGQVVSAIQGFNGTNTEAMAGLILRDNLGESAAYAFLGQRVTSGICFQYRQIAGGMTMRVTNSVMKFPAWLKLSRMGGSVVAEVSPDGRQWHPFGQANVNLGQSVRAGVAVCSGAEGVTAMARFREPTVGAAGAGYAPASGYPRVLLRGGSVLIAPIESADESVVRLGGAFAGSLVAMLNVARIEFVPASPELEARLEPDRQGLVLTDGDFLEGSVRGIATNVVTMSSLLLGFRRFPAGSEAATLQWGAVEPEDAPFRVRTRNGSELRARRVQTGAGTLRAESPLLGSLLLREEEIASVRRVATGKGP